MVGRRFIIRQVLFIMYKMNSKNPEVSIILPCRNEEKALPICLKKLKVVLMKEKLNAEIIVSDSSTDKSPEIAKKFGVKLVKHDLEGYGNAYLEGFKVAKGKYLFLADADGTYDFGELPRFIRLLKDGNDLVVGNRFGGKMEKGAMSGLHKFIGNPLLSGILRLFFRTKLRDSHCGMRAIKKESLDKLNLKTTGMEFASEMIVKSLKNNLKIAELDINYSKRIGKTKLKSFRDGWRHLRFMLLYSPLFLFFIPGLFLFLFGLLFLVTLYFTSINLFGVQLYVHPMFIFSMFILIGYQLIFFSAFSKIYAVTHLGDKSNFLDKIFKHVTLEKSLIFGSITTFVGLITLITIFVKWIGSDFNDLWEIKNSIIAMTSIVLGVQTIFSGFMLSIIGIGER